MNQLNTNSGGVTNFQAISTGELYIRGRRFLDYINEIVFEDNLDDQEVQQIQAFLARLDISGLTGNLIINDSNRNSVLLTAIQALQNKTNLLDTSGLTQTWTIVDNNRNSVLKSSLDSVQNKTNLLDTSGLTQTWTVVDNNRNSVLKSSLDSQAGDISALQTKTQYISSSSNTITINANTINLNGGVYTNNATFPSLSVSSSLTWAQLGALIATTNIPSWVVSQILTSGIPNFVYSDLWAQKSNIVGVKDGSVETTKTAKISNYSLYNTDLNIANLFPVENTFIASGSSSKTILNGSIKQQVFNGDIVIRNNNLTNMNLVDWTLTEADDVVNALYIKGNNMGLHMGSGSQGSSLDFINSVGGDIIFKTGGTNGLKSSTQPSLRIKYANNFLEQIQMGFIDTNVWNPSSIGAKLFVSQLYNQGAGIVVGSPDVYPATNHKFSYYNSTHAHTGALIFQDNIYSGTTNKALYTTESGQKLFYSGQQIYPPLPQATSGGVGITYIIRNPSNANSPQTLTMSEVYLSQPSQSITLSNYTANTEYLIATAIGSIPKDGNPLISGIMQHDQYLAYTANQTGQIYDKVYFRATSTQNGTYDHPVRGTVVYTNVLRFVYPKQNNSEVNNTAIAYTAYIPVSNNSATLTLHTVTIPWVAYSASGNYFARLEIVNASGSVIHQFTDVAYVNATVQTLDFTSGSLQTFNITNTTAFRFKLSNLGTTNPLLIQASNSGAQGNNGLMYVIRGDPNQIYRTLLYDGTTNKTNLVNNTTDDYILTLPITTMDITQLYEPNLQIETYFIQPSGTTSNHVLQFLYNDGYLSHVDSTFSATQSTPNIQQVLTAGNNAGNLNITSLGTIEPSAITGWNVKEITAGTNISRTITSGNYTINNVAPTQDVVSGNAGISISKANNVATISNSGIITATAGSNIGVSVANNNLNITNTANVTDVIAGNGITVSVFGQTATISQSVFQAIGNANDLSTTDATISYGQRAPRYYGARWRHRTDLDDAGNATLAFNDIACSSSGKVVLIAPTNQPMRYSTDYGNLFVQTTYSVGANRKWISLACSIDGETVYALGTTNSTTTTNWRLHISTSHGVFWTERGTTLGLEDITTAVPRHVCCSGDGRKILFTDARAGSSGKVYYSGDSGVNFNTFNVASGVTLADDCCMSSNSQIQYITTNESTGGITHAGIYRSSNFGNNWTKAYTKVAGDSDFGSIDCDTTGRIVVVCRKGGATRNSIVISLDYGVTWGEKLAYTSARSVAITPNGFRIWFGDESGLVEYSDNYGENSTAWDIGSGITHDRICTNINGTVVLACNSTSTTVMPYSYIERFQINEIASHHYFSYTTNLLQAQATGTFTPFPSDFDLENYEYYITFDFDKIYYDKDIYLGFNNQIFVPHQYDAMYYASTVTNNIENLRIREHNLVIQASDGGSPFPIFYSPSAGSFYYCSASLIFRFYAPSQKILIIERQGFTHYRTFSSTVIDGKGLTNSLPDGTGIDHHTIRGRIEYLNSKIYLADNTTRWAPFNFMIFYNNASNIAPASVRISNIERKTKNTITN